jgi:hypothetical protein
MLHVISLKISTMRTKYENKTGMIASYVKKYRELFDKAATYNVIPINVESFTYKVYVGSDGTDYNSRSSHIIDLRNRTCTCGEWQNNELFCQHIIAYYRIMENMSIKQLLELPYCMYYSYEYLNYFYNENINPVIIDLLSSDKTTKPPTITNKRTSGRPVTVRKEHVMITFINVVIVRWWDIQKKDVIDLPDMLNS